MLMEQNDFCIHYGKNWQMVFDTSLNTAHAPGSVLIEVLKPVDSYGTIPHNQFDIQSWDQSRFIEPNSY